MSPQSKEKLANSGLLTGSETIAIKEVEGIGKELLAEKGSYNAFLGTSIDKKFFSKAHMKLYFQWAIDHCDNFLVLIDDYEERHNYQVFKGLSEIEARTRATQRGKEVETAYCRTLSSFDETAQNKIHIVRAEKLLQDPSCISIISTLHNEYLDNPRFRKAIEEQVQTNIGGRIEAWRKQNAISDDNYTQSLPTVANYLLEEIGLSISLRGYHGYPVEVYPAPSMQILKDLYPCEQDIPPYSYLIQNLPVHIPYGYIHLAIE